MCVCVGGWMAACIDAFFTFVHNAVHLLSSPLSLRVMSTLDDSAPHDVCPLPTFSSSTASNLPSCSEVESEGVKVRLVGV